MKKLFTLLIAAFCAAIGGAAETVRVYYDNTITGWANPYVHHWNDNNSSTTWHGDKMTQTAGNSPIYYCDIDTAHTKAIFNDGIASDNSQQTAELAVSANHLYDKHGDTGHAFAAAPTSALTVYLTGTIFGSSHPTKEVNALTGPIAGTEMNGVYTWTNVAMVAADGNTTPTFEFITKLSTDETDSRWNEINNYRRYGADEQESANTFSSTKTELVAYAGNNCDKSWNIPAGIYNISLDVKNLKVSIEKASEQFNVYFKSTQNWSNVYIHYWGGTSSSQWEAAGDPGNAMTQIDETNGIWAYTVPAGTTSVVFSYNSSTTDAKQTNNIEVKPYHCYELGNVTNSKYDVTSSFYASASTDFNYGWSYPQTIYLAGQLERNDWVLKLQQNGSPKPATCSNGVYEWTEVEISKSDSETACFFFCTAVSQSDDANSQNWGVVNGGTRFGPNQTDKDKTLTESEFTNAVVVKYSNYDVTQANAKSWIVPAAKYNVKLDLTKSSADNFTMTLTKVGDATNAIDEIGVDADAPAEYYNLQGIRVAEPTAGKVYIVRRGATATKLLVR